MYTLIARFRNKIHDILVTQCIYKMKGFLSKYTFHWEK